MGSREESTGRITLWALVAVVGFGFLQGARLLDLGTGPYSPDPYAVAGIAAGSLTYLCVAALSYTGRLEKAFPLFVAGCVALAMRIVLGFSPQEFGLVPLAAQLAGGVGWAFVILCWMQVLASYRPEWALPMIAAGYVVDTLLVPLTTALFPQFRTAVFVVVLVLSLGALVVCLRSRGSVAKLMMEEHAPEASMAELVARMKRTLIGTVVFSASCGFVVQLDILSGVHYAQTDSTSILGIVVSFGMCLVIVAFRPKKANIDLAYPLSAAALMSVLLYRSVVSDTTWSGPLMVVLLITFFCLLWMTFTSEAYERKLPAFFLLGIAVGSAQLAIAGGRVLATTALGPLASEHPELALTAVIWLLGVSVAILFVSYLRMFAKSKDNRYVDASDEANETAASIESLNAAALELLRDTYDLSAREFQVVSEFSSGRTARYIADYLVLSEHTVKTHLRRAYAKMDIHSRQELLNLVDAMEGEIHKRA